jgi:tRNA(Glu) U13 pseudouridine synthase TruD
MPVSGIVLTLTREERCREELVGRLRGESRLRLGELDGNYLPAVVEAATSRECAEVCEQLLALAGIECVSVACVDFAEELPDETT